jgi:hypothetical protein
MPSETEDPGFDEARLHAVVRDAVEDAILGAVGTLLLVGIAVVLLATAGSIVLQATAPIGVVIGIGVGLPAAYLFAATLGLIPPIRDWF